MPAAWAWDRPAAGLPGSSRARVPDRHRMGHPRRRLAGAGPGLHGGPLQRRPWAAYPHPSSPGPIPRTRTRLPGQREQLAGGRLASRASRFTGSRTTSTSTADSTARTIPPGRLLGRSGRPRLPRRPGRPGDAAEHRGLYRDAAQLHKNAAARGNLRAVLYFSNPPHCFRADVRPVRWAAAHAPSMTRTPWPRCWTRCGRRAREEQAAALLAVIPPPTPRSMTRTPWPRCWTRCGRRARRSRPPRWLRRVRRPRPLDDPYAVAALLDALREAGAQRAGRRAAAPVIPPPTPALDNPFAVATLLGSLREAGAQSRPRAGRPRRRPRPPRPPVRPGQVCWEACGRRARRSRSPCWPAAPPPLPSTTRTPWPGCWTACGRRARSSRPPRWPPAIPPPTPPSTIRAPWPGCWTPAGRQARSSRPPRCCRP